MNPIFVVALKAGISSSLHTIILRNKTQTKHLINLIYFVYIFPFIRIRYIQTITINTHIDCANNSKCSVGDILLATKQEAFESVFGTFSVTKKWRFWRVISLDMNEPDLSVPSEDEEEEVFPTMCWEHQKMG